MKHRDNTSESTTQVRKKSDSINRETANRIKKLPSVRNALGIMPRNSTSNCSEVRIGELLNGTFAHL